MVEVVALAHDVLLASGNILIAPLSKATCTIPKLQEKREAYSRREQGGFARHRSEVDPPQAY